jgi:hypothetical protein
MTRKLYRKFADAERIAYKNSKDDPEWDYRIGRQGKYFTVQVFDENGEKVGIL